MTRLLLLTVLLSSTASAYKQGSLFVFDVRSTAELETASAGRIQVTPKDASHKSMLDQFAETTEKNQGNEERSEFEVEFNSLGTENENTLKSDFQVGDFGSSSTDTDSAFGESTPPPPTGFYFVY